MTTDKEKTGMPLNSRWLIVTAPILSLLGLNQDEVDKRFVEKRVVEAPDDAGAEVICDASCVTDADWIDCFSDKARGTVRRAMIAVRALAVSAPKDESVVTGTVSRSLLPAAPDEDSFLQSLRVGGVLRVDETDVVSLVRVGMFSAAGVDGLEKRLAEAVEEQAVKNGELAPAVFYELSKLDGRRRHADVLEALEAKGLSITEARKKAMLAKAPELIFQARRHADRVKAWTENWGSTAANPAVVFAALAGGRGGVSLPPMEAPSAQPVVDSSLAFIDAVNKLFAGTGKPVVRALADDATRTLRVLDLPGLLPALRMANKEELLRTFDLGVSADLIRAERDLSTFVRATLQTDRQSAADLPMYLWEMNQLAVNIPWDSLVTRSEGGVRKVQSQRSGPLG